MWHIFKNILILIIVYYSVKYIIIPESVTAFHGDDGGSGLFSKCAYLKEVYWLAASERLPNDAFYKCDSLEKVVITKSVKTIGIGAFSGCDSLKDVYYTGTRSEWSQIAAGDQNYALEDAAIHYNYSVPSWRKSDSGWWYGDDSGWYAKNVTLMIDEKPYTFNAQGYWVP